MTEHYDVIVVGAGLSGVGAGARLLLDRPGTTFTVLEARDTIGGTWDLFRYPGVRSDSDMHTLGYPFRPWTAGKALADGPSILEYVEDTARELGVDRHVRLHHRVTSADWSSEDARWTVTAERTDIGASVELTCGFLYSCTGYYRYDHGYEPEFAGRDDFAGTVVHPQHWPADLDLTGKRVVVIGSGATAMTLVPAIAPTAAHVTMLQRSPTLRRRTAVGRPDRRRRPRAAARRRRVPRGAQQEHRDLRPQLSPVAALPARDAPHPPGRRGQAAARGVRRRHALRAVVRAVGPAPLRRARRRPVHRDQQRVGIGRHRPDRAGSRARVCCSSRARSSRPTSSSPRPASSCCSSAG